MNILKEFSRRIEKFFTTENGQHIQPTIPPKGSTHRDEEWSHTDIYQGELALGLTEGKIFTSDGDKLIHLNQNEGFIVSGMCLSKPLNSFSGNIPFWVTITNGEISINNKRYIWIDDNLDSPVNDNGNLLLPAHTQVGPRIDYIFAVLVYNSTTGEDEVAFQIKSSYNILDINGHPTIGAPDDSIFLGVVYVPDGYNQLSTYALSMYSVCAMSPTYPISNIEPIDFIGGIKRSVLYYKQNQFYFKDQLVLESYPNPDYDPLGSPTQNQYPTILALWGTTNTGYAPGPNPASNGELFAPISGGSGTPGTSVTNAVIITPSNQHLYPGSSIGDLIIIKSDNTQINAGTANANYVHTQNIANTTWLVNHGLEMYPNVTIVDDDNVLILGGVEYIDINTVELTFSEPITGFAYLS